MLLQRVGVVTTAHAKKIFMRALASSGPDLNVELILQIKVSFSERVGVTPSALIVGARLHTCPAPRGVVLFRGLARCPARGRGPVIRGGSMCSTHSQGGVIALEVCLAGHRGGCAPCMGASGLRAAARGIRRRVRAEVTHAGFHEDIERVLVAVLPAGRRFPVGCALGLVRFRTSRRRQVGPVVAPPRTWRSQVRLRRCDTPGP